MVQDKTVQASKLQDKKVQDLMVENQIFQDKSSASFSFQNIIKSSLKESSNKSGKDSIFNVVVSCASGMETLLFQEIEEIILANTNDKNVAKESVSMKQGGSSVELICALDTIYQICLWSRLAEQVLVSLADFCIVEATQQLAREFLYDQVKSIPWESIFPVECSFKVEITGTQTIFDDGRFAALVCKDAIADRFRSQLEKRPNVARENPDVIVQLFAQENKLQLQINVSGERLHKRGYRQLGVEAPLKETLAAAMLREMQWHLKHKELCYFLDPCCGSGTLAIEAMLMAADIAPNLRRALLSNKETLQEGFAFEHLSFHKEQLWKDLLEAAAQRKEHGLKALEASGLKIRAYDSDMTAVKAAQENLASLELDAYVHIEKRAFHQLSALKPSEQAQDKTKGMIVCNPPYGERLQEADELKYLYRFLGERLKQQYPSWYIGVISSQIELIDTLGIEDYSQARFYNGSLKCIFRYGHLKVLDASDKSLELNYFVQRADALADKTLCNALEVDPKAEDFKNRILKNVRKLKPWVVKNNISNFRLYDADIPEFNAAIDCYQSNATMWVVVSEYAAPKTIDENVAKERFSLLLQTLRITFELQREHVYIKTRARQKGKEQYTSKPEVKKKATKLLTAQEAGLNFLINPMDYLDIGLFLDHRRMREIIRSEAKGKRFLNLYAYTGSATVYAASGGAKSTLSVDLNENYLTWARKNLLANGFSLENHYTLKADTLQYLQNSKEQFDLIFLDPPTFSNSKKKNLTFDVQTDHQELILLAMARLDGAGKLYFSTNFSRFELSPTIAERFKVEEISDKTISPDFSRNKPHRSWLIRKG